MSASIGAAKRWWSECLALFDDASEKLEEGRTAGHYRALGPGTWEHFFADFVTPEITKRFSASHQYRKAIQARVSAEVMAGAGRVSGEIPEAHTRELDRLPDVESKQEIYEFAVAEAEKTGRKVTGPQLAGLVNARLCWLDGEAKKHAEIMEGVRDGDRTALLSLAMDEDSRVDRVRLRRLVEDKLRDYERHPAREERRGPGRPLGSKSKVDPVARQCRTVKRLVEEALTEAAGLGDGSIRRGLLAVLSAVDQMMVKS
jgi:hypothetical protein